MGTCRKPLDALTSRNPASWLTIFGPGAIMASLTIGSGELIFSSRGGAVFGYQLLSLFLAVCVFKWALVFATARHMILTGAHPFQRWMDLPGPRGWPAAWRTWSRSSQAMCPRPPVPKPVPPQSRAVGQVG